MYKVFIVEDDPMVLSINTRFTEKVEDFKVVGTSKTGHEALDKIISKKPDLVLLDVYLSEQNGLKILQEIRSTQFYPEVIMITAANDADTVEKAFKLGVLDYIVKPYSFNRFKQSLVSFSNKIQAIKRKDSELSQKDIDKINYSINSNETLQSAASISIELPKGIDKFTLDRVREAIENSTVTLSSSDMADILCLSRVTARKYLEFLVDEKIIKAELKYGSSGRPTKLFFNSQIVDFDKFNIE